MKLDNLIELALRKYGTKNQIKKFDEELADFYQAILENRPKERKLISMVHVLFSMNYPITAMLWRDNFLERVAKKYQNNERPKNIGETIFQARMATWALLEEEDGPDIKDPALDVFAELYIYIMDFISDNHLENKYTRMMWSKMEALKETIKRRLKKS